MAYNLLTEPLIRFETCDGLERGSLPEVYAALMADRVECFPALRAHQEPAWHMFLAQLGAIACHRAGLTAPPADAAMWQDMIGRLTGAEFPNDEPWCLVVEDWSKPAFLQPPVPEGIELKNATPTPDSLDMLITSRNHDLKQSVATGPDADDWVFALVSLQTMEGVNGRLNYGIARMNGGSSSRVLMSLAPMSHAAGEPMLWRGRHVKRDLTQLLLRREALLNRTAIPYPRHGGIALTWTVPWPDGRQLALDALDIWFIEVCRRVRLDGSASQLLAKTGTSSAERVNAKHLSGNLADPWAPIRAPEPASLTLNVHGKFNYKTIVDLLSPNWTLPLLAELGDDESVETKNWMLTLAAIARGNSKTGGFKSRAIPLKGCVARGLVSRRKELHQIATAQIGEINKVCDILKGALDIARRGGRYWDDLSEEEKSKERKDARDKKQKSQPYRDRLDAVADREFFDALWKRFEAEQHGIADDAEAARRAFLLPLIDTASDLLEEGLADITCPSIRRPRAEAPARRASQGCSPKTNPTSRRWPMQPEAQTVRNDLSNTIYDIGRTLADLDPGALADLRRMSLDGDAPTAPYFWRLAARHRFRDDELGTWARIVQIMAILTDKGPPEGKASPHSKKHGLGRALCDGGDPAWGKGETDPRPMLSELRFARLIAARGNMRPELMERAARALAAKKPPDAQVNCTDLAQFLLFPENPAHARKLARDYYARLDRPGQKDDPTANDAATGEAA